MAEELLKRKGFQTILKSGKNDSISQTKLFISPLNEYYCRYSRTRYGHSEEHIHSRIFLTKSMVPIDIPLNV